MVVQVGFGHYYQGHNNSQEDHTWDKPDLFSGFQAQLFVLNYGPQSCEGSKGVVLVTVPYWVYSILIGLSPWTQHLFSVESNNKKKMKIYVLVDNITLKKIHISSILLGHCSVLIAGQ